MLLYTNFMETKLCTCIACDIMLVPHNICTCMYVYAVAASFYKLVQESTISGLRWQHRRQKEVLTGGGGKR